MQKDKNMKVYTSEELKEILELHRKWLNAEDSGIRANLRSADLRYANLSSADLRYADLSSANLRYADLRYADLRSADLRSANLSYADLHSSDLRYADVSSANLSYANLRSADLRYAIGEMRSLRSFQIEKYMVSYTESILNIGCQSHLIEDWKKFDDEKIKDMDYGALEWWTKWKPILMQIIEMSPAEKY
jgi:hypothetical protein